MTIAISSQSTDMRCQATVRATELARIAAKKNTPSASPIWQNDSPLATAIAVSQGHQSERTNSIASNTQDAVSANLPIADWGSDEYPVPEYPVPETSGSLDKTAGSDPIEEGNQEDIDKPWC